MTDAQREELKKLSDEAAALAPRIATEDGRTLLNLFRRVIETLDVGAPVTKPITRHHA